MATPLVKAGASEREGQRKQPQISGGTPGFPAPNPPLLNHQANPGRCPSQAFQSVQYEVSGSGLMLERSVAEQVMGWGRFLLNKSMMTLEVALGWGFIKSFGNKVRRMPETDQLGEMT